MKITVEELRYLLFDIENQEMTVQELRDILYNEENQETIVTDRLLHTY